MLIGSTEASRCRSRTTSSVSNIMISNGLMPGHASTKKVEKALRRRVDVNRACSVNAGRANSVGVYDEKVSTSTIVR